MSDPHAPLTEPVQLNPTRAATLLRRGALLRCPNCGGSGLFRHWVKMREVCPSCHLRLDRGEDDYFLGSYTINFVVSELLVVVGTGLAVFLAWPHVPWGLLTWGLALLVTLAPIIFYPFAKTLWLGADLVFRPLTLQDLAGHGENLPAGPDAGGDEAGGVSAASDPGPSI